MKNKYALPYRVDTFRDGVLLCSEKFCTLDSARVYMRAFCSGEKELKVKHKLIREAK